jgi:TetR/AcrR family transcriptional regulator, cholesterol catabolism regulator
LEQSFVLYIIDEAGRMAQKVRTYIDNEILVQKKRDHIANCAAELFSQNGFKGTTMRQIAAACGQPPGSIYNYIGSKRDILHLICDNASRKWKPSLQNFVDQYDYSHGSITDLLCKCIALYIRNSDEVKHENGFFDREIRNFTREDRQTLLASQANIVSFFEDLLKKGIQSGEFKISSPALVAHNILMVGNNWGERRWFLFPRFSIDEYINLQVEIILNGIRPGQGKQQIR